MTENKLKMYIYDAITGLLDALCGGRESCKKCPCRYEGRCLHDIIKICRDKDMSEED